MNQSILYNHRESTQLSRHSADVAVSSSIHPTMKKIIQNQLYNFVSSALFKKLIYMGIECFNEIEELFSYFNETKELFICTLCISFVHHRY